MNEHAISALRVTSSIRNLFPPSRSFIVMGKDKGRLGFMEKVRKVLHALSSFFMLFYLLPETILWVQREWLLFVPLVLVTFLELVRISQGWLLPGMREYERSNVSGYVWAGATLVLAIVIFPPSMVIPVYVCWAWLDPLCSLMKRDSVLYPFVPFFLYVSLFLVLTVFPGPGNLTPLGRPGDIMAAFITGAIAIMLEYPNLQGYNDDMLMVMGPLIAVSVLNEMVVI